MSEIKSGVVVTKVDSPLKDGFIQVVATIRMEDYPVLDHFDRLVVRSPVSQPADHLQSMEIIMRRAYEQGLVK